MRRSSGFGLDAGDDDAGSSAAAALLTDADSKGAALLDATLLSDSRSGRQHRLLGGRELFGVLLLSWTGGATNAGGPGPFFGRGSGERGFGSLLTSFFPESYCLLTKLTTGKS